MSTFLFEHKLVLICAHIVGGVILFWFTGEMKCLGIEASIQANKGTSKKRIVVYTCLVGVTGVIFWPLFIGSSWNKRNSPSVLERVQELAGPLITSRYRDICAQAGIQLSPALTDSLILDIYKRISSAFRQVSEKRRELLEAGIINRIVLFFIMIYQAQGAEFFKSQLQYELAKYEREGLRADYNNPLSLF